MDDPFALRRSVSSAAIWASAAEELGVPLEVTLRGSGITPAQLDDLDAEVTGRQEIRVLQNLAAAVGPDSPLGILAGRRYRLSSYGVWGLMILSCPTVAAAFDACLRYIRLTFTFSDVSLQLDETTASIVMDDRAVPEEIRLLQRNRDLVAVFTLVHDMLGAPLPSQRVLLPGPPPAPGVVDLYREVTGGIEPEFTGDVLRIVGPVEMLDLPLPQAHPSTAAQCERECARLMQQRRARTGTAGEVRDLIARSGGGLSQDQVAAALHVSVRTLRRRLGEEGTSFRELSAEVSRLIAEELLLGGLPVEDVAMRLGYATSSAFSHAFRGWHGVPPGQFARRRTG